MQTETNVDDFTVPEKILLAADHLDKEGQSQFTAEALIVASWEKSGAYTGEISPLIGTPFPDDGDLHCANMSPRRRSEGAHNAAHPLLCEARFVDSEPGAATRGMLWNGLAA